MVSSRHVPNIGNAITPLTVRWDLLGRLLGGRVQATLLLQNRFLGIGRYCYNRTVNVLVLWGAEIKKHPQF